MGVDPGLNSTGWGIVRQQGGKLIYIASGIVEINSKMPLPEKLLKIYQDLCMSIDLYQPRSFAIEETYINNNPTTSLKLGQARGVAMLAAAGANLKVYEYAPRFIKKAIVGTGTADKVQVLTMINHLLHHKVTDYNEADALATAICHINDRKFYYKINNNV